MRCTARTRSQPVTSGRSGWLRCSSSERKLTTTSTRAPCSARTSRATRSSVDRSAQCRSSITNMSGRSAASRSITPTTSSSRRAVPPSPSGAVPSALSGSRSGSTRASSERAGPMKLVELLGRRVAHERAERVRERAERQAVAAHLDAAAREHPRARLARALGRLLDESCLAHAGLATQEHDRGVPRDRSVERRRQRRQLGVSADEHGTDESASHRAHVLSLRRGRLGEHGQPPVHPTRHNGHMDRRTRLRPRAGVALPCRPIVAGDGRRRMESRSPFGNRRRSTRGRRIAQQGPQKAAKPPRGRLRTILS